MDLKDPNTYVAVSALALTLGAAGILYSQNKTTHSDVEDLKTKMSSLIKDVSKNRPLSNQIQQLGVVILNLDKGLKEMEDTINTIIKKQSEQDAINLNLLQVVDELVKLSPSHEFKHDINHNLRSAINSRKKSGQRNKNSKSNRRKSRRSYSSESDSDTESESENSSDSYDSYESETESESSDEPNYSRNSRKRETSKRSSSSSHGSSGNRKKLINQSTSRHRSDEKSQRYKNVSNGSTHGKHNPRKNKRFKQSRRVRNKVASSEEGSDLDDIIADVDGS